MSMHVVQISRNIHDSLVCSEHGILEVCHRVANLLCTMFELTVEVSESNLDRFDMFCVRSLLTDRMR